ncbi:MAG: TraB/GumN family protein, partial [Gammaproteobacteria bacterium]
MKLVKQLLVLVAVLVTMMPLTGQAEDQDSILHSRGLLWKIEKPGIDASYIYGTMHVGDPRVLNLAPEVNDAFDHARCFGMEVLLNFEAIGVMAQASFFNDGTTLKSLMQSADYIRLLAVLEENLGISESVIINMRPWVVMIMLMMPGESQVDEGSALDMVLYRKAAMRKMQLLGLETVHEQLAI